MKIFGKIIFYFSMLGMLFFYGSCGDAFRLDLMPVSSLTDASYWQTSEHWDSHMNGIHSRFRTHQMEFLRLGEFRSDIWGEQPFTGNTMLELPVHTNTINEDNPGVTGFGGFYSNINQLNLIIDKTINTDILTAENKQYILGQAYGLRAYYYFHLLRSWGGTVIYDQPSYSFKIDELEKAASSEAEVMAFIQTDLENSLTNFSGDYSFRTKVFWSKAATLMLKAEVYLWHARRMGGGTEAATTAKNALLDIQTNITSLALQDNFRDIFSSDNKENDEIIFAIRHALDEYLFSWGSFVPRDIHFGDKHLDSLSGQPYTPETHNILTTGGGLFYAIKNEIYNGFHIDDSRRTASLQAAYLYEDGSYIQQTGVWQNKYQGSFSLGLRVWTDDYPIYRYADLLLMLAEAKGLLNEDPAPEINMIRERAFGDKFSVELHGYPNQPGDEDLDKALLNERLFEFIAEGKRWYDLRRFGPEYVVEYTTADQSRLLWPIDLGALTDNRALTQTPGY